MESHNQTNGLQLVISQQQEFASESDGYTATKHQKEVGTTYFDEVSKQLVQVKALQQQ